MLPPLHRLWLRRETQTGVNGWSPYDPEWPETQALSRKNAGLPPLEDNTRWVYGEDIEEDPNLLEVVDHEQFLVNSGAMYATLCWKACSKDGNALRHVRLMYLPGIQPSLQDRLSGNYHSNNDYKCYMEICEYAVRQEPRALLHMRSKYEGIQKANRGWHLGQIFKIAVEKDGLALGYIPTKTKSFEELATVAVNQNPEAIFHVFPLKNYYVDLAKTAIRRDYNSINAIPKAHPKYRELVELAVQVAGAAGSSTLLRKLESPWITKTAINQKYPGPESDDDDDDYVTEFANNPSEYWFDSSDHYGDVEAGPPPDPDEKKYFIFL